VGAQVFRRRGSIVADVAGEAHALVARHFVLGQIVHRRALIP
jgi:hypothetical protein